METNRHHPLLDEDFATEKTRKSYNLYVYAARIVATGRINENEQKALEDVMEKAKQAVTASSFGQKKKKSIEEKICEYKEASLALRNELVDEEIRVAKLRSGLETSQMSLNMIHVNIEKLQTLCRSLSIEANAVSMENQRLEAVADKERIHWDKANSKLTLLTNRLHNLCMESPRMKDQQEKVRIVVDLQKRVLELEEETERLKMLCNVYIERNASAENVDFVRYVDVHATSIVRLFTNIGKLQNLQNEVDEIRLVTAGDDIRDPLEMSLAELDDTAYLLQYAQKSSAGVHSDESLEVVPPQNEVSAAKDSVVRKYVEEQSPVHQSQESSAMVPSVEDPNEANLPTSGSFQQKQPYPTVEDPVNYIPSVAITQPYANESAPHIVSYPEMANRLVETDVESVLNMTKNSEDPGSEFLQLMEADKAVGPFGDEPFGVAAGGDTVFDFAEFADMNFGVSMDVGDTPQFNLESSQNLDMGFPSADVTGDGADFFGLFNSSSS